MTRILLIRHGTTDLLGRALYGRTPGIHLNREGCRQAQETGEALKARYQIDAVVSSPLERATQTAHFIADPYSLGASTDEGLNELEFGEWVGKSFSELNELEQWRQFNEHRSMMRAPGGESLIEVQMRAWRSLEHISAQYRDATVAAITHGDVIRCVLMLMLGMPLDYILRLEISPASVSDIVLGGGNPVVCSMNETMFRRQPEKIKEPQR